MQKTETKILLMIFCCFKQQKFINSLFLSIFCEKENSEKMVEKNSSNRSGHPRRFESWTPTPLISNETSQAYIL